MAFIQTFIGDLVAQKRKAKGWSQHLLAKKCMVHITTIEKLENHETWPRHHTLWMLFQVLEIKEIGDYFNKRRERSDKAHLAKFLKKMRCDYEFTVAELALQSGLQRNYILKFEDCKTAFKEKHIEALAFVFKMNSVQFIERAEAEFLCD